MFAQELGSSTRNRGSHLYFPFSLGYHARFNEPAQRLQVDEDDLTLNNIDVNLAMGWRSFISNTHSMGLEGALRFRSEREIYECIDDTPCGVPLLQNSAIDRNVDSQVAVDVSLWYVNRFFVSPVELQLLFGFSFVGIGDRGIYITVEQSGTDDDNEPEYEYRSFDAINITIDVGGRAGLPLDDTTLFFIEALYALPIGVNAGNICTLGALELNQEYPDYERSNCSNSGYLRAIMTIGETVCGLVLVLRLPTLAVQLHRN